MRHLDNPVLSATISVEHKWGFGVHRFLISFFAILLSAATVQAQDEVLTLEQAIDAYTDNNRPTAEFLTAFLNVDVVMAIQETDEDLPEGEELLNGTEFQDGLLFYGFESVDALADWQATWSDDDPLYAISSGRDLVLMALNAGQPIYLVINYGTDQIMMVPGHFELYRAN